MHVVTVALYVAIALVRCVWHLQQCMHSTIHASAAVLGAQYHYCWAHVLA
jgi:uncharacterized membrane protein YqjE